MMLWTEKNEDGTSLWILWRGIHIYRKNHGRGYLFDPYGPPIELPRTPVDNSQPDHAWTPTGCKARKLAKEFSGE